MGIHEIYKNAHNRHGLVEAAKEAGIHGVIILDNGHHGYGYYCDQEIKDFSHEEIPKNLNLIEVKNKNEVVGLVYKGTDDNDDLIRATVNSLNLYGEYRSSQERDPKFGTYNKNYVLNFNPRELPYGILMLDLDHFKLINDTYGHEAGDEVLKTLVENVNKILPRGAFLARYGGEEFSIVIPESNIKEVYQLADRLNRIIRNTIVLYEDKKIQVTISIGGGIYQGNISITDAIKDADKKLYESKNSGRDRATINKYNKLQK